MVGIQLNAIPVGVSVGVQGTHLSATWCRLSVGVLMGVPVSVPVSVAVGISVDVPVGV
jgi:hypothetical protein